MEQFYWIFIFCFNHDVFISFLFFLFLYIYACEEGQMDEEINQSR